MAKAPSSDGKPATVAQRVAGGLLILNAGLYFLGAWLGMSSARIFQTTNAVGAIFDLALGALVAAGRADLVWLVLARLLLSPVIRTLWKDAPDPGALALQLVLAASLLVLVLGEAGRVRLVGGCLLFAAYLTLGALTL